MINELLDTIKQKKREGNLAAVKFLFDIYFGSKNFTDHRSTDLQYELSNEYVDFLVKFNNLNISPTNPIFVKLDSIKKSIEKKIKTGEMLSEEEIDIKKLILYQPFYNMHWGTYSGKLISDIFNEDAMYLLWCIINLNHFSTSNTLFLVKYIRNHQDYLKAMEINLIKHLIIEKWGTDNYGNFKKAKKPYDDSGPESYDFDSWDEMAFKTAFEGDIDAWNNYNN